MRTELTRVLKEERTTLAHARSKTIQIFITRARVTRRVSNSRVRSKQSVLGVGLAHGLSRSVKRASGVE